MPAVAHEKANVEVWRYDELRRVGYPPHVAVVLAKRETVDLHQACDMLRAGCPLGVALEILR